MDTTYGAPATGGVGASSTGGEGGANPGSDGGDAHARGDSGGGGDDGAGGVQTGGAAGGIDALSGGVAGACATESGGECNGLGGQNSTGGSDDLEAGFAGASAGAGGAVARCGASESQGQNRDCYRAFPTPVTGTSARAACQSYRQGWALATIRSGEDNDFLMALTSYEAWIGGSDAAMEGAWIWIADQARFWSGDGTTGYAVNNAYTNWNASSAEPNGGSSSDCLRLLANGHWADFECNELLGYVCQGPPQ